MKGGNKERSGRRAAKGAVMITVAAVMIMAAAFIPFISTGADDAADGVLGAPGELTWAQNYGGAGGDVIWSGIGTSDGGFVAVGYLMNASFGTGDWTGLTGNGGDDAVIFKVGSDGVMEWAKNFGGSGNDNFYGVTETSDGGLVAVGNAGSASFGNGDLATLTSNGASEAIIVKYGSDGTLLWAYNFGGGSTDTFADVAETSDGGLVAAGYSSADSIGTGDLTGVTAKGGQDGVIAKFHDDGTLDWCDSFGGSGNDWLRGVTAAPGGGFVIAGYSNIESFGNGDFADLTSRGYSDGVVAKFGNDGALIWVTNVGGLGYDYFDKVTPGADGGFAAVGYALMGSFGTGDLVGLTGNGNQDMLIAKLSDDGTVEWCNNLGGPDNDVGYCATAMPDGGFAIAGSQYGLARFNSDGTMVWSGDLYEVMENHTIYCLVPLPDGGVMAIGDGRLNLSNPFGLTEQGGRDAVLIRIDNMDQEATITISDKTVKPGQTIDLPTVTGNADGLQPSPAPTWSDFTITYTGTGTTEYGPSTTAPSDEGTYDVQIELNYPGYWAPAETVTLTIGPADVHGGHGGWMMSVLYVILIGYLLFLVLMGLRRQT
ncbi:MAG: hypothetical protein FWH44_02690 [Methanomassiliicoccaceae archaeon]|nr:hypothetical protein [Methanomassiliicoccaceae archaeon]